MVLNPFCLPAPPDCPPGAVVPALTPHAVSVSLPKWQDNVDYEEGTERMKQCMTSGYPRFFIHHRIQKLMDLTTARFGLPNETCLLLPTVNAASSCRNFLASRDPPVHSRLVRFPIESSSEPSSSTPLTLHACFFDRKDASVAKQFWQHTGDGISSRLADRCLALLENVDPLAEQAEEDASMIAMKGGRYAASKTRAVSAGLQGASAVPSSKLRYASNGRKKSSGDSTPSSTMANSIDSLTKASIEANGSAILATEEDVLERYVEERYGRNLHVSLAPMAKLAMRRRIAGVFRESSRTAAVDDFGERDDPSTRGVAELTEDDVWLYPCGMSAIFHSHQIAMLARQNTNQPVGKSVCFGFPYTDTYKILQKWGPGCHFFGNGLAEDLPALRKACEDAEVPILAVFCEFPSNPLLRTPPLTELRRLADEFGFMIIIDETIAGFINVEVLPQADIVVSSLTKVFSGDSNVMGGSLALNPKSRYYESLKDALAVDYCDAYFDEDAIYMERNSRDFQQRVAVENHNALTLCEMLRSRRAPGPSAKGVIDPPPIPDDDPTARVVKEVYYPKYMTPHHYEEFLRQPTSDSPSPAGHGGLFSLTFTTLDASRAFFDALECYKGPSLGTNFTLACPYTILAHYTELDWASEWGVESGLVRISTGLEDAELLLKWFKKALVAAEATAK